MVSNHTQTVPKYNEKINGSINVNGLEHDTLKYFFWNIPIFSGNPHILISDRPLLQGPVIWLALYDSLGHQSAYYYNNIAQYRADSLQFDYNIISAELNIPQMVLWTSDSSDSVAITAEINIPKIVLSAHEPVLAFHEDLNGFRTMYRELVFYDDSSLIVHMDTINYENPNPGKWSKNGDSLYITIDSTLHRFHYQVDLDSLKMFSVPVPENNLYLLEGFGNLEASSLDSAWWIYRWIYYRVE